MSDRTRMLPIPDGLVGERVDVAVARITGWSRTAAARAVDEGRVRLGGENCHRSSRLAGDGWLEIDFEDPRPAPPTAVLPSQQQPVRPLAVLFEDDDVIVLDKPIGVAAHGSPGWEGPTITGMLAAAGRRVSQLGPAERQGIVHRLDVGTTCAMVVALSDRAYSELKQQFRDRSVTKRYRALVQGHPDPTSGTIDAPIGRHPTSDRFAVVAGGRPSVTHYDTLEAFRYATLLDVHLETGRTHQIRVHMAAMRHPCCGDTTYGADPVLARQLGLERQWLHAAHLEFDHPADGRRVIVDSPDPPDLAFALDVLAEP